MNNIDRAAKAIFLEAGPLSTHDAEDVAQALADAGLLAPEPVEPHTTPSGDTAFLGNQLQTDPVGVWVESLISGDYIALEACQGWGEGPAFLNPSDARKVAAALLSAANRAEQHE